MAKTAKRVSRAWRIKPAKGRANPPAKQKPSGVGQATGRSNSKRKTKKWDQAKHPRSKITGRFV